jgi:hypothetical protein
MKIVGDDRLGLKGDEVCYMSRRPQASPDGFRILNRVIRICKRIERSGKIRQGQD